VHALIAKQQTVLGNGKAGIRYPVADL
jgi:hypothetical protein